MNFIHILKFMVLGIVVIHAEDVAAQTGEDEAPRRICAPPSTRTDRKRKACGATSGEAREITRDFIIGDNVYQPICVGFTSGEGEYGTGICEYCEQQLGTTEYSFLNGVHPAPVGCSTLPVPGRQYVCCAN